MRQWVLPVIALRDLVRAVDAAAPAALGAPSDCGPRQCWDAREDGELVYALA